LKLRFHDDNDYDDDGDDDDNNNNNNNNVYLPSLMMKVPDHVYVLG
jgi:hypothetical protein